MSLLETSSLNTGSAALVQPVFVIKGPLLTDTDDTFPDMYLPSLPAIPVDEPCSATVSDSVQSDYCEFDGFEIVGPSDDIEPELSFDANHALEVTDDSHVGNGMQPVEHASLRDSSSDGFGRLPSRQDTDCESLASVVGHCMVVHLMPRMLVKTAG